MIRVLLRSLYVKGQKVYNAFVSIEVPKIGYKGNYDIRIINDEPNKEFEPIPIPKKKNQILSVQQNLQRLLQKLKL